MSLLWADDFKSYGTSTANLLDGVYAEVNSSGTGSIDLVTDPDSGSSGNVLFIRTNSAQASTYPTYGTFVRFVFPAAKTTVGGFLRLYLPGLPSVSTDSQNIIFSDGGNTPQLTFRIATTGAIEVYRGAERSGTLLGTSTVCLTANAWHHIEWKILASQTVGTVEIRVNGAVVLSLTGQDTCATANVSFDQMAVGCNRSSSSGGTTGTEAAASYWKDFVVWDAAGSINNDFFGPCLVKACRPDADTSFNWTASTGSTGYTLIDETSPNDADYISADVTQTTQSEFGVENLPVDVTTVRGMILMSRMWASDGGDCKVQMGVKSNGDQGLGTDRQITVAPTYWKDVIETSPDTGVQFTPTEFNSMTFTIDRTL